MTAATIIYFMCGYNNRKSGLNKKVMVLNGDGGVVTWMVMYMYIVRYTLLVMTDKNYGIFLNIDIKNSA